MQIMYVCTGNQCRSVMAEYYTRAKLADRGIGLQNDNITVRSAGTLPRCLFRSATPLLVL